ncbi:hypothetical protein PTTG_11744 [Puccinia triticina 1-1 BBBD Race 1]|uniref:Uncharacterized protein n=1 Tax=Puccinia triticina (isolate 1-1 / race 1 (BBBD)) TaxID=630390 RepID=A0A180H2B1_PUCT1|nr:hypothetical protein PTTG_11744 [Puccinia triticina 1-1 BBBD Race 1]
MNVFKAYLFLFRFICFISSYHSLEINRLRARSLANLNTPHTISTATKSAETLDSTQDLVHLGSSSANSPILEGFRPHGKATGEVVPHAPNREGALGDPQVTATQSGKEQEFQGSGEPSKVGNPIPAAAESPEKGKNLVPKIKSKFAAFYQMLKAPFQGFVKYWKDFIYCSRIVFRKRHDDWEIVRFENARDTIGKYLALNERELKLADGKPFDLKSVAKTLEEKSPLFPSDKNRVPMESYYEDYLKILKKYQLIADGKNLPRKSWLSELPPEQLPDHAKIIAELENSLEELNKPGIKEQFKTELDDAVKTTVKAAKGQIKKKEVYSALLGMFPKGNSDKQINLEKLASAREVQLKKKYPTDRRFLDLEHVFRNLPPDLDLNKLVFRYSMVEGFENILEKMRLKLQPTLHGQAQAGITNVIAKHLNSNPEEESILAIASKDDLEWKENAFMKFYGTAVMPSQLFERLRNHPEEEEIIRYTIKNNVDSIDFLQKAQWDMLWQAPTRKLFTDQVKIFERIFEKSGDHKASTRVEKLKNLRRDAEKTYQFNLPLVQELTEKGIINDSLIQGARGNEQDFLKALGTSEQFQKGVMDQFETNMNKHLRELSSRVTQEITNQAASRVTQSQLNNLIRMPSLNISQQIHLQNQIHSDLTRL